MHITNAMPGEKFVRQLPRTNKKEAEGSKKFGVPVKKLVEKIDNDIPEGATIIDRRLSAFRAPMSGQWCAAIVAMRERRALSIFPTKETFSLRFLDDRDRGVAQDKLRRFVGHSLRQIMKTRSERPFRIVRSSIRRSLALPTESRSTWKL